MFETLFFKVDPYPALSGKVNQVSKASSVCSETVSLMNINFE